MRNIAPLFVRLLISVICLCKYFPTAVFAQGISSNKITLPATKSIIPLQWLGDSIGGDWTPYAALLIPIRIDHCPRVFYMQFDTGSPYSMLYTNALQSIQSTYPGALPQRMIEGKLNDFICTAGSTPIQASEIGVASVDTNSIDLGDTTTPHIIGTFGSDLIDNKIIVFDYRSNRLVVSDTLDAAISQAVSFSNFIYNHHSILLPAFIGGKSTHVFFDTGASMFSLVTDKATSEQLADAGEQSTTYAVPSWGNAMTTHTYLTHDSLQIAGMRLALGTVTYMEGAQPSQVERMRAMGIGGLIGNVLFLGRVLILDTKQQRVGIIE